jgi:hypothetical protein
LVAVPCLPDTGGDLGLVKATKMPLYLLCANDILQVAGMHPRDKNPFDQVLYAESLGLLGNLFAENWIEMGYEPGPY